RVADEARAAAGGGRGQRREASPPGPAACYSTFGSFWFAVPRRLLLQRVARRLCHRLVQRWRAQGVDGLARTAREWVTEQAAERLGPEELAPVLAKAAVAILGEGPAGRLGAVLAPYHPGQPRDLCGGAVQVAEALEGLAQFVGAPDSSAVAAASSEMGQ